MTDREMYDIFESLRNDVCMTSSMMRASIDAWKMKYINEEDIDENGYVHMSIPSSPPPAPKPRDVFRVDVSKMTLSEAENLIGTKSFVNVDGYGNPIYLPEALSWLDDDLVPPISANPGYYMNTHIAWWKRLLINVWLIMKGSHGGHGGAK